MKMWFTKKKSVYPIGLDMSDDILKLIELGENGEGLTIVGGSSGSRPDGVAAGSSVWQRWAIDVVRSMTSNGKFQSREVVAAIPPNEVFIDHIRLPKGKEAGTDEAIISRIKQRLPFDAANAVIKYVPTENDNIMVIAMERGKIDRYLAIFENANLQIKSMVAWPVALTNSYCKFFGRRKSDLDTVVMLIDMDAKMTNVVICRYQKILFARSIGMPMRQISNEKMAQLLLELNACRRQASSIYDQLKIERLIFLTGLSSDKETCIKTAKQMELSAQIGDCLAAVETEDVNKLGIDRRECQYSWATAFGLSLS
jgi:Tfp pilus assembly PilM family ATPase